MEHSFETKWKKVVSDPENTEERSIFVDLGQTPRTQRQLELYHYFLFIKRILETNGATEVLELGCGRGTMGLYLAKYLGLTVSLLDSVPEAIQIAKQAFAQAGQAGTFYLADAVQTGLPDETFDAVISIGLAEHFERVDSLFREQHRLLRPGGIMISLNMPKKFSVQILNTTMRFLKKLVGAHPGDIRKDYYRNTLTAKKYERAARAAGFTETRVIYVCPFPFFIPIKLTTDRRVATLERWILAWRGIFQAYPFKTNRLLARSHFLVGYKAGGTPVDQASSQL